MGTISKIKAGTTTHYIASTAYCYCDTAAGTAAKVANVIGDSDNTYATFTLIKGTTVHVMFVYSNTASSPTLNVGGTGAKTIVRYGTTKPGTTTATSWRAKAIVPLTYNGTYWVINHGFDNDTTYANYTESKDSSTTSVTTRGEKYEWTNGLDKAYSNIATRETGSTASRSYTADEHLFYQNTLFRVAQPIASGASLDTQITSDNMMYSTVGDELTDCSRVIEAQTISRTPVNGITINWRYRMFTNGYIEGFGHATGTFTHYYKFGTVYGYYCNVPLPEQFGDTGVVAEVSWNIGSAFGASAGVKGNRTTEIQVYGISNASGSQVCHIFIHIQGRKAQ